MSQLLLSKARYDSHLASVRSSLSEREQIRIDQILMGRAHAVRQARVDFQRGAIDDLGRGQSRGADRHDLIIVAVHDEGRYVELLEIFGEIGFGKRFEAKKRTQESRQ